METPDPEVRAPKDDGWQGYICCGLVRGSPLPLACTARALQGLYHAFAGNESFLNGVAFR